MSNGTREIGLVRPYIMGAEVVEVRTEGGTDWAIYRVPLFPGDKAGNAQVVDSRPETVEAARAVTKLSTTRTSSDEFNRVAHEARNALNSGAAEGAIKERNIVGGGMSIILFPTDEEPKAVLAIIRTRHRYFISQFLGRPFQRTRRIKGEVVYFNTHTIVADAGRPVEVWELDPESVKLTTVSLEDGVSEKYYNPAPTTAPTPAPEPPTATAPPAEEPAEPSLKEVIGGPVQNGELTKLAQLGITTVEKFLAETDKDFDGMVDTTGVPKSRLIKAIRQAKAWIKANRPEAE